MNKANDEIRAKAKAANVKFWEIAAKLGVHEITFTKKLRFELPDEEKQRVFSIIEELHNQREEKN